MSRSPITLSLRGAQSGPLSAPQNDANLNALRAAILLSAECPADSLGNGIAWGRIGDTSAPGTVKSPSYYDARPGEYTEIKTVVSLALPAGTGYAIVTTYSDASGFVKQEALTQASPTQPLKFMRVGNSSGWQPWYYVQMITENPANQQWMTGDIKYTLQPIVQPGWVIANDGSIGPQGSSATTRANNDTLALFTFLWQNYPQFAPISGGAHGSNATADWNAGKTIQTGTIAGRVMAAAGLGLGLSPRTAGQTLGEEKHLLTGAESGLLSHQHTIAQHEHPINWATAPQTGSTTQCLTNIAPTAPHAGTTGMGGTPNTDMSDPVDASSPHNTMQPTFIGYVWLKL